MGATGGSAHVLGARSVDACMRTDAGLATTACVRSRRLAFRARECYERACVRVCVRCACAWSVSGTARSNIVPSRRTAHIGLAAEGHQWNFRACSAGGVQLSGD